MIFLVSLGFSRNFSTVKVSGGSLVCCSLTVCHQFQQDVLTSSQFDPSNKYIVSRQKKKKNTFSPIGACPCHP